MTYYTVLTIPLPPAEDYITQYSKVRLLGLQTDPHAFGSTYARESEFTRDQWRARLDTPGRVTIIAQAAPSCDQPHVPESNPSCVGTASILLPAMLQAAQFSPPADVVAEGVAVYILVGMWMHPEHRRRGLAQRLISAGIDSVRGDAAEVREKVLMLQVHENNGAARSLYEKLGFQNRGMGVGDEVEEIWMVLCIENGNQH